MRLVLRNIFVGTIGTIAVFGLTWVDRDVKPIPSGYGPLLILAVSVGFVFANLRLPHISAALKPMARAEQKAYVADLAVKRNDLQRRIRALSEDRDGYLAKKVEEAGGMKDSLDQQIYEAVKQQAGKAGLEYEDGPSY